MGCIACQAPLSIGFTRQENWSGKSFPSPGNLPDAGTKLASLASPALVGEFFSIWPKSLEFRHWKNSNIMGRTVQLLSHVWRFVTPWTAAHQASLPITNSQSLLKLTSIKSGCHPTISPSVITFSSSLQSFPSSGSFPMSDFASGCQSIGASASASVLPMNIYDWFPLVLTSWISLQSRGLSKASSNIIVQKYQFFSTQLSL